MATILTIIKLLDYCSIEQVMASTGLDLQAITPHLKALANSGLIILSYGERGNGIGITDPLGQLYTHCYAT